MATNQKSTTKSAKRTAFTVPDAAKAIVHHHVTVEGARKTPDGTKGIVTAVYPNRYGGLSIRIAGDDGEAYFVSSLKCIKAGKKASDAKIAALNAERDALYEETVFVIGDMDAVRQNDNSVLLRIDGLMQPLWFNLEHVERHTGKVDDGKAIFALPIYGFKKLGELTQDALRDKSPAVEKLIS